MTRDDITDRELLELAAKAAGIEVWWNGRTCFLLEDGVAKYEWNPLNGDGDALRLVVKLGFCVNIKERCVIAGNSPKNDWQQPLGDDPLAATRRAIVRAAAEIGRNMP